MPHPSPDRAHTETWIVQAWTASLARVIEAMTGEAPPFDIRPATGDVCGELRWWEQRLDLVPNATVWVGALASDWSHVGSTLLQAAGVNADEAALNSTYDELMCQSFSGLARSLAARLNREVTCSTLQEAAPGADGIRYSVLLQVRERNVSMVIALSEELLRASEEASAKIDIPTTMSTPKPPRSIDLLLDVELPVSVSFGRAQLPLKDVVKLTTGSIVELNRAVSEPVDIIVNNCVIARGQVVVVEGNFGVRIQQVISRQERMRTLR